MALKAVPTISEYRNGQQRLLRGFIEGLREREAVMLEFTLNVVKPCIEDKVILALDLMCRDMDLDNMFRTLADTDARGFIYDNLESV